MKKRVLLSLIFSSVLCAENAYDNEYQLALKAGTLGIGVELSHRVNAHYALRLNINGLRLSNVPLTYEWINASVNLRLLTVGGVVDYYPDPKSGFYYSGGLYVNANKVAVKTEMLSAFVTSLDATLSYASFNPYIGIGYQHKLTRNLSVVADAGFLLHGAGAFTSKITIDPSLPAGEKNTVRANKDKFDTDTRNAIAHYPLYPVLMLGLAYRF